jgi:hypothetical protein
MPCCSSQRVTWWVPMASPTPVYTSSCGRKPIPSASPTLSTRRGCRIPVHLGVADESPPPPGEKEGDAKAGDGSRHPFAGKPPRAAGIRRRPVTRGRERTRAPRPRQQGAGDESARADGRPAAGARERRWKGSDLRRSVGGRGFGLRFKLRDIAPSRQGDPESAESGLRARNKLSGASAAGSPEPGQWHRSGDRNRGPVEDLEAEGIFL